MSIRIYGNRELKTLPGLATRPTSARVRQAVFNIWQGAIGDCQWLDLCSGSGAMGAEALCRGAKLVVGIDRSAAACKLIRHNWQQVVGTAQTFEVIHGEIVSKISLFAGRQFDRIYFDPPYAGNLYAPMLAAIEQLELLAPDGELAVEHSSDPKQIANLPPLLALELCRLKIYGSTAISFYRRSDRTEEPGGGVDR